MFSMKMGNFNSCDSKSKKEKKTLKKKLRQNDSQDGKDVGFSAEINADYDVELQRMRRNLETDQEAFILNNLMLCVQFFKNYEEEIKDIRNTPVSQHEGALNAQLSSYQKHVLLPDVLQEHLARNIWFTSSRQTSRLAIEPLQPVRMYVVLNNVEIPVGHGYSSPVLNAFSYKITLEPSSQKGYVKLQRKEVTRPNKIASEDESADPLCISEDEDESRNEEDSGFDPNPGKSLLTQVKRLAEAPKKPAFSQSTSDLQEMDSTYHDRRKQSSHANQLMPRSPDREKDEPRFDSSVRRLSGLNKPQSEMAMRGEINRQTNQKPGPMRNGAIPKHRSVHSSPASSTSSGYRSGSGNYGVDSDSDSYGYATITNLNTPKPLEISGNGKIPLSSSEIPESCFQELTYTHDGKLYDENEEKRQSQNSTQKRLKTALKKTNELRYYFKSVQFMKHFGDLFINHLADALGFDTEAVANAKMHSSVLYCDTMELLENRNHAVVVPYEITPCIQADWPACANDWLTRTRYEILDPVTDQKFHCWPTSEMMVDVKRFGCHIVPEGYMPKRGGNPDHDIEWQLSFPKAERYLETCFRNAQLRVYMIALILHKTYIRPVDTPFGLTTSHIRTMLFWLCEQDNRPSKWPENRSGECLRRFLKKLKSALSQSEPSLPDYFIRGKDLFQNIPRDYINVALKQIKRINENPIMYVINSMRNIRHKTDFFPVIDFKRIIKLLTVEDVLHVIRPDLGSVYAEPFSNAPRKRVVVDVEDLEEHCDHPGEFWDKEKSKTVPGNRSHQTVVTNRTVINSIDANNQIIEIPVQCRELEGQRLSALLDMFIKHFIQIAERCYEYAAIKQKNLYLNQAERLSMLLYDHPTNRDDANRYLQHIRDLRKQFSRSHSQNEPPETPRRNDAPVSSLLMRSRFTNDFTEAGSTTPPIPEETKVYEEPPLRRPTVGFRVTAEHISLNGTITTANVGDIELRSSGLTSGSTPRVVSLNADTAESYLTETTYI